MARHPLTLRGVAVLGFIAIALVLGVLFGARSLNAVVAPAVIAVLVAVWRVRSIDPPAISRRLPVEGTVGDVVEVDVTFEEELDRLGHIEDVVEPPLIATGNAADVDLSRGLTYSLELGRRGRHRVGPARVTVRDVLGLASTTFERRGRGTILVLPRVYRLRGEGLDRLATLAGVQLKRERHEFDRLREYRPTDSLRDVHWKTSAKRPDVDFIVKEFVSDVDRGALVISGGASEDGADVLADAMASLATALLQAGVKVGIESPSGRIDPVDTSLGLDDIYEHLAVMDAGPPNRRGQVHVDVEGECLAAATIEIGDEHLPFEALIDGPATRTGPPTGRATPSVEVAD